MLHKNEKRNKTDENIENFDECLDFKINLDIWEVEILTLYIYLEINRQPMRAQRVFTYFTFLLLSVLVNAQELEILRNNIIDKELIQDRLPEYKMISDSILQIDTTNSNAYRVSSFIDINQFRFTRTRAKLKKAIRLDSIQNNMLGLAEDYNILATYYKDLQKNDSAYIFYHKALDLSKKRSPKLAGRHLHDIAMMHGIRGQKDSSIVQINNALKFSAKAKDSFNILMLDIRERNLLKRGGQDFNSAKTLYKYGSRIGNNYIKSLANSMLGKHYQNSKDSLHFAIQHLDSAIIYFEKSKNIFLLNSSYSSRAYVSKKDSLSKNKPIYYYKKQYEISKNTGHIYEGMTLVNLAGEYYEMGKIQEAERFNKKVIKLSESQEVQKILLAIAHENLSKIYESQKRYKEALSEYKMLYENEIKAYSTKIADQANKYKIEYQTEKKEKELAEQKIATQEQELLTQKANTRNWFLAIGLLALGISAFFVWKRYKSEAKAKQIISKQKTQIEKLQKEFHHRLKNDFRSINSYIGLIQRQFKDTNFRDRLNELKNRVTSMFKVHEILLQEDDITQVKAHPYLLELTQNVEDKYSNKNITVICTVDETETIMADKAIPFGIVLNEFVTNSYKYAFDEQGGEININFNSDTDNHYLILKDNGKGLPNDFNIDNLRSLGMSIIPMFANLHDGSYQLDGTNGVSLTLILPKRVA